MRRFIFPVLFLSACTAAPPPKIQANSWEDRCYLDFGRDVSEVAGESAIDCGFLPLRAGKSERAATHACARSAVRSGKAFKFGYQSFGDDSRFCDVAIRRADGQFISFFVDDDVTGQLGAEGNNLVVWTSRCTDIEFKPGTIGEGSFFDLQDCTEAPEIFSGLSSRQ